MKNVTLLMGKHSTALLVGELCLKFLDVVVLHHIEKNCGGG